MQRSNYKVPAALLVTVVGLTLAIVIARVAPATAAPPPSNVIVSNVPLPVSGTVSISGTPAVQPAIPTTPFFSEVTLTPTDGAKGMGVASGTLGVVTITISNFNSTEQQLFLFNPVMEVPGSCSGSIIGGSTPLAHLLLEPSKTVQLQYPTALAFTPISGTSCIAAEVTTAQDASVTVSVNGFVQ